MRGWLCAANNATIKTEWDQNITENAQLPFTYQCCRWLLLHCCSLMLTKWTLNVSEAKLPTISKEWTHPYGATTACFVYLGVIISIWDPCKNPSERLQAWRRDEDRLTEVVGHQRRGRGRRLGELLSPAALLLQVLQEETSYGESKHDWNQTCALFNFDFSIFLLLNDTIDHTLLTSVLTSRTDLKSLDIEASLDCGQKTT